MGAGREYLIEKKKEGRPINITHKYVWHIESYPVIYHPLSVNFQWLNTQDVLYIFNCQVINMLLKLVQCIRVSNKFCYHHANKQWNIPK